MTEILIGMVLVPTLRYVVGKRLGGYLDKQIDDDRFSIMKDHYFSEAAGNGHMNAINGCYEARCARL